MRAVLYYLINIQHHPINTLKEESMSNNKLLSELHEVIIKLEALFEIMHKQQGGTCELNMSEACGYYVALEVLGEPDKTYVSKTYSNKLWAIEAALDFAQQYK